MKRTPLKRTTALKAKTHLKAKTPLKPRKSNGLKIRRDPLDILFSEFIRRRSKGYCQRCGQYYGWKKLQACHFHGRARQSVRYDPDNAIAGCMGCHVYLDSQPMEKVDFFKRLLGEEKFDMLNSRMRNTGKIDKQAIELYLKAKIEEFKNGI